MTALTPKEAMGIVDRLTQDASREAMAEGERLLTDYTSISAQLADALAAAPTEPQKPRPRVVCLCGSSRFYKAFERANMEETLAGNIVLSIGTTRRSDQELLTAGDLTVGQKVKLDELHLRKIDLADEVLILNQNGYMGESTRRELAYARAQGKKVRFLERGWKNA